MRLTDLPSDFYLQVRITRKHIDGAQIQNVRRCPIARAIKQSDADILLPHVDRRLTWFSRSSTNMTYRFRTPAIARQFVIDFDNERDLKPFVLVLRREDLISITPRTLTSNGKNGELVQFVAHPRTAPPDVAPDAAPDVASDVADKPRITKPRSTNQWSSTPVERKSYLKRSTEADD